MVWAAVISLGSASWIDYIGRFRDGDLNELYTTKSLFQEINQLTYPPDDFYKITQDRITKSSPHPCDTAKDKPIWRSESRPNSVHKLRPGDIDVIAAMGDSITSANVARESSALGLLIQDRGVSFTGGGIGTWHDITTLPNIIKVFNPNLTGYAVGRGDFFSYNAQLNVAIPAALDEDLFTQVKLFMKKMLQDKRINFRRDWKLLSIMIGDNDICSKKCYDGRKNSPEAHKHHLQRSLDYLYKNVPRLFVNIVSILDPTIAVRIPSAAGCYTFRRVSCSCLYKVSNMKEAIVKLASDVRDYQEAEKELVFSGRYDGREDFTVELQPFNKALNAPRKLGEPEKKRFLELLVSELPIWTPECFHLNQRGHAAVSIQLWNNMLEPSDNKTMEIEDIKVNEYKCPSKETPYFFTKKNTENYNKLGRQ